MIKEYYVMPPRIKAVQWDGTNYQEIQGKMNRLDFQGMDPTTSMLAYRDRHDLPVTVNKGDYIVFGSSVMILTEEEFLNSYQEVPDIKESK